MFKFFTELNIAVPLSRYFSSTDHAHKITVQLTHLGVTIVFEKHCDGHSSLSYLTLCKKATHSQVTTFKNVVSTTKHRYQWLAGGCDLKIGHFHN